MDLHVFDKFQFTVMMLFISCKLIQQRTLQVSFWILLTFITLEFFIACLLSGLKRYSRFILSYLYLPFLQETLVFFSGKYYFNNTIWVLYRTPCCWFNHCFLVLTYTCIHMHQIYTYPSSFKCSFQVKNHNTDIFNANSESQSFY